MKNPTADHMEGVNEIMRYLKNTPRKKGMLDEMNNAE